tara:strand:+ start:1195 stop:1473 length:279 start_codon:yes stop_codon:yes gene_type:complete
MNRFVWTAEKTAILVAGREASPPVPWGTLAPKVDATILQCKDKIKRLAEGVDAGPDKPEDVERICLSCRGSFIAKGRFMRVCYVCKSSKMWE